MAKNSAIKINTRHAGERLDIFLSTQLKITRSQARKLYEEKRIKINGRVARKIGEKIKAGDKINIAPARKIAAGKIVIRQKIMAAPKIKIIKLAPDYIIVEKPWGLLTHGLPGKKAPNLADELAKKYPEIKKIGDHPALRPGIVHRLDKEASGLLVVARTPKMFRCLKKQFQQRTVAKEYLALAHGRIIAEHGFISFPLSRAKKRGLMAARPMTHRKISTVSGREALTEFEVIKKFINFTLVKVKIHTGRTHQIRAHFLAYNHPLVGDPLYFHKKQKNAHPLNRLFLHSTELAFNDLSGTRQAFVSPLPAPLKKFLTIIK